MTIYEKVGSNIRKIRISKGWDILELSIVANVNKNYLSDLERGVRNPTLMVLNKIAKALDVPLKELFL